MKNCYVNILKVIALMISIVAMPLTVLAQDSSQLNRSEPTNNQDRRMQQGISTRIGIDMTNLTEDQRVTVEEAQDEYNKVEDEALDNLVAAGVFLQENVEAYLIQRDTVSMRANGRGQLGGQQTSDRQMLQYGQGQLQDPNQTNKQQPNREASQSGRFPERTNLQRLQYIDIWNSIDTNTLNDTQKTAWDAANAKLVQGQMLFTEVLKTVGVEYVEQEWIPVAEEDIH